MSKKKPVFVLTELIIGAFCFKLWLLTPDGKVYVVTSTHTSMCVYIHVYICTHVYVIKIAQNYTYLTMCGVLWLFSLVRFLLVYLFF